MNAEHFSTLLESIATITWRADPTGFANELSSWCAYTGRSVEDALGWGWLEDIHPEDRARTSAVWSEATESARQYRVEYRIRNRDGDYRWFDVHGTPLLDDRGRVEAFVGACIDIHDRVEAQERLRSVVDNMSEAFITIDADWRITFQNQEGARINGKPPEAVLGKKLWEEWPEVLDSALERNYRAAMADGKRRRFEHRYYDPGRYDVWLDVQAVPTGDGGLGIFYLDISQRKQAEREVVASERRFRQLAGHLQAAFLLTAGNGAEVVYASPFVQTLFGASPEALARDAGLLLTRVHPRDRSRVEEGVWADPSGNVETEYRLVDGDGNQRWVYHRSTAVPGDDHDGSEPRVAHIVTDVTERLQLERQLRQSQRMESLGRLAGGVAHDFNNVLTVILGRASMLYLRLQEESGAEDWPEITEIEDAATRAAKITRQILAFARSESGNPVLLDLNRVIQRSSAFFRSLLEESIEYVALLEDGLPSVRMDPAQLDQVLVNLMVNASQAMGGEGTLTVATRSVEVDAAAGGAPAPGRYVELSVQDTGEGIDPGIVDKIFDPFFSTKEERGGSGLGLATCYGIVSAAGGTLQVESTPGAGATFRILLPAREAAPEAELVEEVDTDPQGSETILVVEDEARLRRMIRDVLQVLGYTVHTAVSGEEALERMEDLGGVDLVVTDVVMPGMSGATLARRLLESDPELPILTVSGYQAGETPAESRVPRELAFLPKPFTPRELARRIRNILNHLAD